MADNVASSLVMFIAALLIAGLAAATMANVVGSFAVELRDRGQGLSQAVGADLALVNDPSNVPYSGGSLTLYVKNVGSNTLFTEELLVLVDGVDRTFTSTLLDGATNWSPGVVAQLTVTASLSPGDHRARVVHTPSVADDLEFRV